MFTPQEREAIRGELIELARADDRISGCALTGSGSLGKEDRWSDIDLAFGVKDASDIPAIVESFTGHLYARHGAVHHLDLNLGTWIFRVFFIESTLQIDLEFVRKEEFCGIAPSFKLVFGECVEKPYPPSPKADGLIGWAWLHALHVRSSIERAKLWQAEYMIEGMRNLVLALACLRHGLETNHARGLHLLPVEETAPLEASLVGRLEREELIRAFQVITDALIREIGFASSELESRLKDPLNALATFGVRSP